MAEVNLYVTCVLATDFCSKQQIMNIVLSRHLRMAVQLAATTPREKLRNGRTKHASE